jgi:transposase-like protein
MAHKTERLEARRLYVEEGKSIREIAATLSLNEKTVYRWSTEDAWENERASMAFTGISTVKNSLLLAVRAMEKMVQAKEINAREVDAIMKLIKGAKSLSRDIDKRGNILLGVGELIEFLRESHPESLEQLQPFLVEFGGWVKRKYP